MYFLSPRLSNSTSLPFCWKSPTERSLLWWRVFRWAPKVMSNRNPQNLEQFYIESKFPCIYGTIYAYVPCYSTKKSRRPKYLLNIDLFSTSKEKSQCLNLKVIILHIYAVCTDLKYLEYINRKITLYRIWNVCSIHCPPVKSADRPVS